MPNCFFFYPCKKNLFLFVMAFFLAMVCIAESNAVTKFGSGVNISPPMPLNFDDTWFYDDTMDKVIAEVNLDWLSVVFAPTVPNANKTALGGADPEVIRQKAKELTQSHRALVDFFYDGNLLEDGVFFQLQKGITPSDLRHLIATLNHYPSVDYAHPVLTIKDKRYAFFNAFELAWKTGVSVDIKARMLKQAHVVKDEAENVYRIDIRKTNLFQAINLLAEDIHTRKATPYLVELTPTIGASLSFPIHGGHVGDVFPFKFEMFFSDAVEIDPGAMATLDIRPTGIQKELFEVSIDPYDYVAVAAQSPVRITGTLKLFAVGEYTIPPIAIRFMCNTCSNKQVRVIETQKVILKVSSIVPSTQIDNDLIVPMNNPPLTSNRKDYRGRSVPHLLLSIVALVIALLFLTAFILRLKKAKANAAQLQQHSNVDVLKERLGVLLQKSASAASQWQDVLALNDTLRAYLATRYGFAGNPAGGSGDVFLEAVSHTVPSHLMSNLKTIFNIIDRVISQEMSHSPDMKELRESVLRLLEQDRRT